MKRRCTGSLVRRSDLPKSLVCSRATMPEERGPAEARPSRIIRAGFVAKLWRRRRDGRVESREAEAYLKKYVRVGREEPARRHTIKRRLVAAASPQL